MTRILIAALIVLPMPVMAHVGDHTASGWWHFLTEADHLAFAALAAAGAAMAFRIWRRK